MNDLTIYHNPRCSKSRQTLQIIKDHGIAACSGGVFKSAFKEI